MNFTEALTQTAPRKGPSCSVGKYLTTLTAKERAEVEAALANTELQSAHLTRALSAMSGGGKFDPQSVTRHRRSGCNCARA